MNEVTVLMFSGGVDSVVCLSELVKQGIIPKLFFIKTYKVKQKHIERVKKLAKLLSPKSELYIFKPRMIDYCCSWSQHDTAKHSYYIHMHEQDSIPELYPLRYCDKLVLGYVGKENIGRRRKGELGLAQPKFIKHCQDHSFPFIFPLGDKTTRQVDELFDQLPKEIQKLTVSSTRDYQFGGAYLHD